MTAIPLPAELVPLREEYPHYSLAVRWTNPETGPGLTQYVATRNDGAVTTAFSVDSLRTAMAELDKQGSGNERGPQRARTLSRRARAGAGR